MLLGGDRAAPMVLAPLLERGERRRVWEYLRFYLRNGALLALGVAAVVWTLAALHAGSADPRHHHPLAWVVLVLPLSAAGAMLSRTPAKRPAQAALPWRIGLPAIQLALLGLVVLVQGGLGLVEAILIGVVATAAIAAGQWLQVRRLGLVEVARAPDAGRERAWLAASLPIMGSFLVALALSQSDLYFLELLGEETQVGHYAAAATAAHLVIVIQTSVVGLIAPIARPAIERGAADSRATYRRGQTLMLAAILPVGVALAATASPVLGMFGAGYRDAHAILVLLTAGHVAWAAAALSTLWLQYRGRAGLVLTIAIATLAADSILNLLLIPRYGMTGAAAHTSLLEDSDSHVRSAAARAAGKLGDAGSVELLRRNLTDSNDHVVSASCIALGVVGGSHDGPQLATLLDHENRFVCGPRQRGDGDSAPRCGPSRARQGPRGPHPRRKRRRWGGLWEALREQFYDLTAAPGPSSFSLIIGRALEVMEERHGGGEARGWKERDYQRVLAGLLQMAGERFRVLTEAEPADRSRLDIYIEDVGGSARALLELKLDGSEAVSRHARQLLRYRDELRARGTHVEPHLILLDRASKPAWTPQERRRHEGEVAVWLAHVNRQPPSAG